LKRNLKRAGVLVVVLLSVASIGLVLSQLSERPKTAKATEVKPLINSSSVADILDYAQSSKDRWNSIYVEGRSGTNGVYETFSTLVEKPMKYHSREGVNLFIGNAEKQWLVLPQIKKVKEYEIQPIPADVKAEIDKNLAVHRAEDPTLSQEGDFVVPTPVNDLINPGYLVRKELKYVAKSVQKIGPINLAGRRAVQLKVIFPKELAKEDHWDIFVDMETGILLGITIHPRQGNDKIEMLIDKLEINPSGGSNRFRYFPPADYSVERMTR